jgi:hypothetical protein
LDIVNSLLSGIGGLARPPAQSNILASQPFKTDLIVTNGDAAYDTMAEVLAIIGALAAGSVWTLIWQLTVPAQQQIRWGYGSPALPMNQGYMWFASLDSGTNFQEGVVRLVQANARQTKVLTVLEQADSRLHTATVTTLATATPIDKNDMIALPEKVEFPRVGEDSLLQIWYRCTTAATTEDAVGFAIPATVYQ